MLKFWRYDLSGGFVALHPQPQCLLVIVGVLLQEHLATREALEAESCKAKQSFVQLEAEILKLRREKEQDASQFQAALQQYESRLAEANARVKDAESKSVSQREKDMQSLKHLQVELEKALGSVSLSSSHPHDRFPHRSMLPTSPWACGLLLVSSRHVGGFL